MKLKTISPSAVDSVNYWLMRESASTESLVSELLGEAESSPAARVGTAWHAVVQALAQGDGEYESDGSLLFDTLEFRVDAEIALPYLERVEVPVSLMLQVAGKPILMRGLVDGIDTIGHAHEFKTRTRAIARDAMVRTHYFNKSQWRCYLLALGVERITYHVFQMSRKRKSDKAEELRSVIAYWREDFEYYPDLKEDLADAVESAIDVIDAVCPEYWRRNDER